MKIKLSSKYLAKQLLAFNFEAETIEKIIVKKSYLLLKSKKKTVRIDGDLSLSLPDLKGFSEQQYVGWVLIKNLVNSIDAQDIELKISERSVNVIFEY